MTVKIPPARRAQAGGHPRAEWSRTGADRSAQAGEAGVQGGFQVGGGAAGHQDQHAALDPGEQRGRLPVGVQVRGGRSGGVGGTVRAGGPQRARGSAWHQAVRPPGASVPRPPSRTVDGDDGSGNGPSAGAR